MNHFLDRGRFEHSVAGGQKVKMYTGVGLCEFLQLLAIGSWNDSVVGSKSEVHSSRPCRQCLRNLLVRRPTKPMSAPPKPDHHSHAVVRNVKRTEAMQVLRNDSSFEQQVVASDHKISMPVKAEPNQFAQFRVNC